MIAPPAISVRARRGASARKGKQMDLGYYHPIVVHFAIALLFVGVAFRLLSLIKRFSWLSPAAFLLILLGTGAAVAAVKSGTDAHGPVERIPGARPAVQEHEDWGEHTRNAFIAVLAIEIVALLLRRNKYHRLILALSGLAGAGALIPLYETAEHGGELVYEYAGGIGTRGGDEEAVRRLFLAALHQQAQLARRQQRPADAARVYQTMRENFPDNFEVQLAFADSLLRDANDPEQTLQNLGEIKVPEGNPRAGIQVALLKADALAKLDRVEEARAILQDLLEKNPGNRRIQRSLDDLKD